MAVNGLFAMVLVPQARYCFYWYSRSEYVDTVSDRTFVLYGYSTKQPKASDGKRHVTLSKRISIISLRHSVNGDFCGHSRFVVWHENLTTFVSLTLGLLPNLNPGGGGGRGGGGGLALIHSKSWP